MHDQRVWQVQNLMHDLIRNKTPIRRSLGLHEVYKINDEPTGSARGMHHEPTRETIQRRFSLVQGLRVAHACFLQTRDRKKNRSPFLTFHT